MWLILNPGLLNEQVHPLPEGPTVIGRAPECTLQVVHSSLSRMHARLERQGERVVLEDLGSKNGTSVNGERVGRRELRAGESFWCGELLFKLVADMGGLEPTRIQGLHTRFSPDSKDVLSESGRTSEKLRTLLKATQLLASLGPIEGLLERILQLVFQIMEVDLAAILLVDPASGELRPRVARLASGPTPSGSFYSQRVVDYVRTHSVAALFADARQDLRLDGADSVVLQSIRASMCAPLKPRDTLLGVLYVDNRSRAHGFSQEDLEFLTAFASQAAIALENSLLSQRLADEAVLRNTYLRFFPPPVIKRLEEARGPALDVVEAEVTVLFSDITGFTSLASRLHPRQLVELLNAYFPVMADIVFRHEGTLEKYIGDALMAVWGAPFSQPDDADRALRAAVEMQRALAALNTRWRAQGQPELQIHVGLNTGRVAAGNIGSEQFLQYATIGDATNVASRICGVAEAGEIYVSETTVQRCQERAWPLTRLPPVQVKGKEEALTLYRLEWRDLSGG